MKTLFDKFVCCLLLIILFCGCTPKDNRIIINFASWGSKSETDILKPIIEDFEQKNPDIKIDFMHIPQNYFQKIHLLFASNTQPDVIFINNLYLPVYANAGVLAPVEDSIDLSIYDKNILQSLSWNGVLYAVPRDVSNLVIFYNKDLFNKYHVPYPRQDWTFNEFLQTAEALTRNGHFGISFEEDSLFFLPYLMSEGGGILSDDLSKEIIESEESQNGLKFYAGLRKTHHVAPRADESASATMAQMFLQQKIAMHLTGRWLVPKYREEADFDWDIVNFPKGRAGSIVPLDSSGWAVAAKSAHKKEAFRFVAYLSSKESIEKFTQSGLIVPARSDVENSRYFLDGKKPEHAEIFLDVIKTSKPTPVIVNYKEVLDKYNSVFEHAFN